MKWTNILHISGFICSILGFISLWDKGWNLFQWPIISCLWILSSYISSFNSHKQQVEIKELESEKYNLIKQLSESDLRAWKAEYMLEKEKIVK
jgi:hypothetical protein